MQTLYLFDSSYLVKTPEITFKQLEHTLVWQIIVFIHIYFSLFLKQKQT